MIATDLVGSRVQLRTDDFDGVGYVRAVIFSIDTLILYVQLPDGRLRPVDSSWSGLQVLDGGSQNRLETAINNLVKVLRPE